MTAPQTTEHRPGPEPQMPIVGGCNCGAVRFQIDRPFESASYCHCTRCQRRTGAGSSANARAVPGSFRIIEGERSLAAWKPDRGAEKWFCALCGSALFSVLRGDPDRIGVRLGAVDGDPGIRPQAHQFVAFAAPWEAIADDGLPRYSERAP